MGCGGSRLGGLAAGRANDGGVLPIPAGLRPLLRRRLEEMKKRSHAGVLKGNKTPSKKELLRQGSSEKGGETGENDDSLNSTSNVVPAPDLHMEEKKEVIYENILSKDEIKEVKEEEENVNKQEEASHHEDLNDEAINVKKEGDDNGTDMDNEVINVMNEDNDGINHDDNQGRMSNFDERMICPGSPSFRVYCVDVASDDEGEKDGEDMRKSLETESVILEPKEEESIVKKEKRERKGKKFGIALPRKYLANVTAPCYAGGGGCMGNTHSRLAQEKSSQ